MRIAVFISHPIQHWNPLWQELSKRPGVDLKVFYYNRTGVQAALDPGFGVKFAWDVDLCAGHEHEFLPPRWPARGERDLSWKALNAGIKRALDEQWHVVHLFGYARLNNWLVLRHCRRMGIPVLYQSDSSVLTAFDKPKLKLLAKRLIVPRFLSRVSACLAIGDQNREYLLRYGAPPEKVFFVPYPVDIKRFRDAAGAATAEGLADLRARYGIPENKRIIIFNGKLIARKRPQDVCDAVERLKRDDILALLIGDGVLRAELERRYGDKVVVTGFVNQREIPLIISLAALAVMPSSYDAHPLAVTEALCLGVPVLLSDRCGCYGPHDVLRDGEDGMVYRCGDVDELSERIVYLLEHDDVYTRMSQRARELADTQSPSQAADRFLEGARAVASRGRQ